jgi:hypothetical protein
MIQRIQSIYLILGVVALGALFFFDTIWNSPAAVEHAWFAPSLTALTGFAMAVGAGAIFLYRARQRQRTVVLGAQMIVILLLVTLYGGLFMSGGFDVRQPSGYDVGRIMALLLPIVAYVFYYLARRGIERDIQQVEDMERFRLRD